MRAARAVILAFMLCWAWAAAADVAVPPLTGRVVDLTGTLSSDQIASLDNKLKDFEDRKGTQIAVLIVPTTAPETIEQYSLRVVEQWKLGRKKIDDGALLIVAKDDRRLRIEVGYGLEGVLNDATARRIIDEIITPKFRTGDFAGGIIDGTNRIERVVDGEPLPAPKPKSDTSASFDSLGEFFPVLIIGALVVGGILRAILGRLLGSLVMGGGVAFIAWSMLGVLPVALIAGLIAFFVTLIGDAVGTGGGGRYSTGGGWSSGGSGGSGGGFSGGGGSFGGGGASGRW
ncbi:TPM domain-containing protein [Bradyrhizobium sp. SYSU BS000235]|uniref:TPM domain-containing protein n=1 Tax=Bradyrhizobium sp. SYSU BS000235 TaxID=3411332 RepID=UPI003C78C4C8